MRHAILTICILSAIFILVVGCVSDAATSNIKKDATWVITDSTSYEGQITFYTDDTGCLEYTKESSSVIKQCFSYSYKSGKTYTLKTDANQYDFILSDDGLVTTSILPGVKFMRALT